MDTTEDINQNNAASMGTDSERIPEEGKDSASTERGIDITNGQDGGVFKLIKREGTSDESPGIGDTVFVHYVGTLSDGTTFDSSRDRGVKFEFQLGKGKVIKAWDVGVSAMKKGELAVLTCAPDYAYGEIGALPKIPPNATLTFEVELFRWQGEDISDLKDGGIIRSQIVRGGGYSHPNEGATVSVHVTGRCAGSVFEDRSVEFIQGEGEQHGICEGIDMAIKKFKTGEKSRLTIQSKYAFGSAGKSELNVPADAEVVYEVELEHFEKSRESWEMDTAEKAEQAEISKAKGTSFFKEQKYKDALKCYMKVFSLLEFETSLEGDQQQQRNALVLASHLNQAICHLKLNNSHEAATQCDKALEIDNQNEKALFRRGQARLEKNETELAMEDFKELLKIDPKNKAAKSQLNTAIQKQKQYSQTQKQIYKGMFSKFAEADKKRNLPDQSPYADQNVFEKVADWDNRMAKGMMPLEQEQEAFKEDGAPEEVEAAEQTVQNGEADGH